jgi:hypothetical protein
LEQVVFSENELIVATQNDGLGEGDWIAIFPADLQRVDCEPQLDYTSWLFAGDIGDTTVFPAQAAGDYVLQLFQGGTYCAIGDAVPFSVEANVDILVDVLPEEDAIFRPTAEHFPLPEADIQVENLTRSSIICFTTNGVLPVWQGGACGGEGVQRILAPGPSTTITISCDGETGPEVARPLNILFNWAGALLYRAETDYQLKCDEVLEEDPVEQEEPEQEEDQQQEEEQGPPEEEEQPEDEEELAAEIALAQLEYQAGEVVSVTFTVSADYLAESGNVANWIGIFPASEVRRQPRYCETLNDLVGVAGAVGESGTVSFAGLPAGSYSAQAFAGDSFCHISESVTFSVLADGADSCPEDACGVGSENRVVLNPYANVDWATWQQNKGNFHTHTTNSDGDYGAAEVIDAYYAAGYQILSITDHDETTWPWTDYNRDPAALGMLAVRGNEFSRSHHVNGFFNYTAERAIHNNAIADIQSVHDSGVDALCLFNHPLRYNAADSWDWYVPYYQDNSACVGIETINRTTHAHDLWDNINENYFAESGQLVWGYANDDMHNTGELFRSFQFMLMPELTESALVDSKTTGAFYFCHEAGGSGEARVPKLADIVVNDELQMITLVPQAQDYDSIQWVGPGSQVVGNGLVFDFSNYPSNSFVRAELHGAEGSCYTQPFGIGSSE